MRRLQRLATQVDNIRAQVIQRSRQLGGGPCTTLQTGHWTTLPVTMLLIAAGRQQMMQLPNITCSRYMKLSMTLVIAARPPRMMRLGILLILPRQPDTPAAAAIRPSTCKRPWWIPTRISDFQPSESPKVPLLLNQMGDEGGGNRSSVTKPMNGKDGARPFIPQSMIQMKVELGFKSFFSSTESLLQWLFLSNGPCSTLSLRCLFPTPGFKGFYNDSLLP